MSFMGLTACLVVYPITVNNFAVLFNCMPADRSSESMMVSVLKHQVSWLKLGTLEPKAGKI